MSVIDMFCEETDAGKQKEINSGRIEGFQEAYILIRTVKGKSDDKDSQRLFENLQMIPYLVRADEVFGSAIADYISLVRYPSDDKPSKNKDVMDQLRRSLSSNPLIADFQILGIGDGYRHKMFKLSSSD